MNTFWLSVGALIPPIGVGVIFWLVMRWIVRADRQERAAIARIDAAERDAAERDAPPRED
ncbi:hypothetical protein OEB99_11875 [Actinotalea sp. M2MS4P-6]|uniref:hypothetical protein n=1 Tax=Actinotalea sp. M2MS4P-6 TaxID=2983762 RepID=UPI0021E4F728|nr:hypothetical protein [Actinotalea sp. M2MS4P-6]MCV2395007.1 hypothetical protein [Actinotalea sp. M2MS4P-6]